jgi:RNA polymerase sigma factor (sigma-70 family)
MSEQALYLGTMEEVVMTYSKSVQSLARKLNNLKLFDKWLHEDLVQQGFVGLIEAYERYDSNKACGHFWGYARKFVKGRMVDFTAEHFNYLKPSKQVNAVMLQIHKRNLKDKSPEVIADLCGCSSRIAVEALHLLIARRPIYLHEPVRGGENLQDKEFIDLIESNHEQDDTTLAEITSGSTDIEKKVIQLLMNGYSRENIIEHTHIRAIHLKEIIDAILLKCGHDPKTISNRNEERLMKISSVETKIPLLQEAPQQCFEWVDINNISASPKNPRKNLSANSQQMQEILAIKGWEEAITCYRRGPYYFILSGHRRWNAAKELGEKRFEPANFESCSLNLMIS